MASLGHTELREYGQVSHTAYLSPLLDKKFESIRTTASLSQQGIGYGDVET